MDDALIHMFIGFHARLSLNEISITIEPPFN